MMYTIIVIRRYLLMIRRPLRSTLTDALLPYPTLFRFTILKGRDEGLSLPAGAVLLSPEVGLTEGGDSFSTNRGIDTVLSGSLMALNRLYAASVRSEEHTSELQSLLRIPYAVL